MIEKKEEMDDILFERLDKRLSVNPFLFRDFIIDTKKKFLIDHKKPPTKK